MDRTRNFCFTANNPTPEGRQALLGIKSKYIVWGDEIAPSTGTPHLQGHITFPQPKTLSAAIKNIQKAHPGAHVEISRAPQESIAYCKKEGTVTEQGEAPLSQNKKGEAEKQRWKNLLSLAQEGNFEEIAELAPREWIMNKSKFEDIYNCSMLERTLSDTEESHLWFWGSSGTGKSRKARTDYPNAYLKSCNKWWSHYKHQDEVIIEDFDVKHGDPLVHFLKIWADRYSFPAEYKGGQMVIRPKKIIVTSNYHPRDIWTAPGDLEPILRRFTCVEFKNLKRPAEQTPDLTPQKKQRT